MSHVQPIAGAGMYGLEGTAIDRVAGLRDVIAAGGDQAQELRRLPESCVTELVDAGFFRFTLPEELGGEDASSIETIEVLEAISAIDTSVGWNVMLGSEINADGGRRHGGGSREGDLPRQPAGHHVRRWRHRIGAGHRSTAARRRIQGDRRVDLPERLLERRLVLHAGTRGGGGPGHPSCRHVDDADAVHAPLGVGDRRDLGRGRHPRFGSDTVRANGSLVRPEHAAVDLVEMPPRYDNPVFRIPIPLRLSYNKVAIALGIARGALDAFVDLAHNKVPMLSPSKLMDRPIAQIRVAECEAKYRAVRAYVMESMAAVEDELTLGADMPSAMTTQNARLACVHASNMCMEVVDVLHNTAGTSAAYMANPLERKLRDAHGAASHRWVSHSLYQDLGAIILGHTPAAEFAGTGGPGLGARRSD